MLSLNNAFGPDEVREFGVRVERAIGSRERIRLRAEDRRAGDVDHLLGWRLRARGDARQRRRGRGRHRKCAHHPVGADDAGASRRRPPRRARGPRRGLPSQGCVRRDTTRASRRPASPDTRIPATLRRVRCASSTPRITARARPADLHVRDRPAGQDTQPGRGARHARRAGLSRQSAPPARRVDRRGARISRALVGAAA